MKIPATQVTLGSIIGHRGIVYQVNSLNHLFDTATQSEVVTVVFYATQMSNREQHVISVPAQTMIHVKETVSL